MSHDFLPVHLIQSFVVFVESANITEAAGRLNISQPAVSVHLKKLEEFLPEPVFIKQGKRKSLSNYGVALYKNLAPIFHSLQKGVEQTNQHFQHKSRPLQIAGPSDFVDLLVEKGFFENSAHFTDCSFEEALSGLQSGRFDLAIADKTIQGFEAQQLCEIHWDLRVHGELTTHAEDWKNLSWLLNTPLIAAEESFEWQSWLIECGLQNTALKKPDFIVSSWSQAQQLVENKKGYVVAPSYKTSILSSGVSSQKVFESRTKAVFINYHNHSATQTPGS